jgi:hypothetical protein
MGIGGRALVTGENQSRESRPVVSGQAFGESPRWHNGRLWFSDFGAQEVVALDLSGKDWRLVTMPTLVLVGSESPAFLRYGAQALAEALPRVRLLTQKGLGHTKKLSTKLIASVLVELFEANEVFA